MGMAAARFGLSDLLGTNLKVSWLLALSASDKSVTSPTHTILMLLRRHQPKPEAGYVRHQPGFQ